jgi:hypothetical protein
VAKVEDVKKVLEDAGNELKAGLWKPEDKAFLAARARDLIGLAAKAAAVTDKRKQAAYVAAARDTVNHVKLLVLIRMEVGANHLAEALGKFFLELVLPVLVRILPALAAIQ